MKKEFKLLIIFAMSQIVVFFSVFVMLASKNLILISTLNMICFVITILGFWALTVLFVKVLRRSHLEVEMELKKMKVHTSKRFYEMIESQNKQIRKLYHDLENHLLVIKELKEEGCNQEVKDYVARIEDVYEKSLSFNFCEDETINIIFKRYMEEFKEKGLIIDINAQIELQFIDRMKFIESVIKIFDVLIEQGYHGKILIMDKTIVLEETVKIKDNYLLVKYFTHKEVAYV